MGGKSMRLSYLLPAILLVSSCSTMKNPESFEEKMHRYQATKYSDNKVPQIDFPNAKDYLSGRAPASIPSKKIDKKSLSLSNKRLYFLTLHSQYSVLNELSGSKGANLNVCPSFHTSLLQQKHTLKSQSPKNAINFEKVNYASNTNNFAELHLPITRNSLTPKVMDVISEEGNLVVQTALEIHLSKTYSELQELCEFGNSDNYYTFENLYTLVQMGKLTNNETKYEALMKTTLFTNNVLIKSLKKHGHGGRQPASYKVDTDKSLMNEIYQRLQSPINDDQIEKLLSSK